MIGVILLPTDRGHAPGRLDGGGLWARCGVRVSPAS